MPIKFTILDDALLLTEFLNDTAGIRSRTEFDVDLDVDSCRIHQINGVLLEFKLSRSEAIHQYSSSMRLPRPRSKTNPLQRPRRDLTVISKTLSTETSVTRNTWNYNKVDEEW